MLTFCMDDNGVADLIYSIEEINGAVLYDTKYDSRHRRNSFHTFSLGVEMECLHDTYYTILTRDDDKYTHIHVNPVSVTRKLQCAYTLP